MTSPKDDKTPVLGTGASGDPAKPEAKAPVAKAKTEKAVAPPEQALSA